jgi:hypothetical protein
LRSQWKLGAGRRQNEFLEERKNMRSKFAHMWNERRLRIKTLVLVTAWNCLIWLCVGWR